MSHQSFHYLQSSMFSQLCGSFTDSRVYTFNLGSIHFHITVFPYLYDSLRIHDSLSLAVSASIVLFNIFYFGILSDEKAVDTVMLAGIIGSAVDTAACNDSHVTVVSNIEIIVNRLL